MTGCKCWILFGSHSVARMCTDSDIRPPPIVHHGPQNQTLPISSMAVLQCVVSGDPPPTVRWYKNGRLLTLAEHRFLLRDTGSLQIGGTLLLCRPDVLYNSWLRSTVGRTPVFGRRTDPVLRSACSRRMTTMWVNRPLQVSQLGQLSLSSLRGR